MIVGKIRLFLAAQPTGESMVLLIHATGKSHDVRTKRRQNLTCDSHKHYKTKLKNLKVNKVKLKKTEKATLKDEVVHTFASSRI